MRVSRLSLLYAVSIVFLMLPVAHAEPTLLCGKDISHIDSAYKWDYIQDSVPIDLYPGGAGKIYQQLFDQYQHDVSEVDRSRDEVNKFIALQRSIISGNKSALLSIKAGPFSGEELLSANDTVFAIPCSDVEETWLVDIANLSITYRKIHDASFDVLRETADNNIQRLNQKYQQWFDNGLPMWPQESWFNGLFLDESDAEEPANHQWVLLRPSVGIAGNASRGINNNQLEAALGVELFGYVRYVSDDYSDYWGVSAFASLGEDVGAGYGALIRYNNYMLGYTKRDKDVSAGIVEDSEYLFIGYDLYQLINEKKDGFVSYKRKIRETLEN